MNRYDFTKPNLNFRNDKVRNLVNKLIYKGQILEWDDIPRSPYFRAPWGKFKVTSVRLNSWGSIYVNVRLIDGEIYNKPLIDEFTKQKTQYKNNQEKSRWKWYNLTSIVNKQLRLIGFPAGNIFIKRLTIR
tara:strand:- start:890 stop:1282 length:393 start_codon:yes stop_codon:yes gene_type:complete